MIKKKRTFTEIFEYIRLYIKTNKVEYEKRVKAKEVGIELSEAAGGDITSGNIGIWKSRNSIPYDVVLDWCAAEGVNPLSVFYK
jgi:hypothetical protein